MTTEATATPPESTLESARPESVAPDTRALFSRALKGLLNLEQLQSGVRATPRGIFVAQPLVENVTGAYSRFLATTSGGVAEIHSQKAFKRLFNSSMPALLYLVEPKRALVGYLIEMPLQNPQGLGLPTYLGTLDDARTTLHPRDPLLAQLSGVQVGFGSEGIELQFTARGKTMRASERFLREFAATALTSHTLRREVRRSSALRDLIPILIRSLDRSHPIQESQRLLLPFRLAKRKDLEFLVLGAMVWIVDRRGTLQLCYEREGRGLYFFVKREVHALANQRSTVTQGVIHLMRSKGKSFGTMNVNRVRYAIAYAVLVEFVKGIQHSAPEGRRNWKRFTIAECIQELSETLAEAQPIDRSKISRLVERRKSRDIMYVINQRWIFIVGKRNRIEGCIDKTLAGHS